MTKKSPDVRSTWAGLSKREHLNENRRTQNPTRSTPRQALALLAALLVDASLSGPGVES